ncbi:hypothetical protein BV20DRAFT_813615 [Pilatotrama ljubarskyi]|nr:hypothetical protein BV20DRAFT_813615 [Pilatotrama ljubarskyi]
MASDEHDQVVYLKDSLTRILSPKSPAVAEAVFGSAPRSRKPSTPKSPAAHLPATSSASRTSTPAKKDKMLPPVPGPTVLSPKSPSTRRTVAPAGARTRAAKRPDSPDVETMIARTPRPRRKSSATFNPPLTRPRSNSNMVPSSWKGGIKAKEKEKVADDNESVISDYGTLLKDDDSDMERMLEGEGSESDSSIDIHTPLPHLMFRDGLLSPRSKLLPAGTTPLSLYMDDATEGKRANSVLSVASEATSTMTKSGVYRDPRDTQRRRQRHKDQSLLRAGMGLTTGLGWSDSEDEDAPSMLTRRLISTSIAKHPATVSRAPSQLTKSTSVGNLNLSHPPPSYSPAPRPGARALSRSTSASFSHSRLSITETESVTSVEAEPIGPPSRSRTQSNASVSSVVSSGSRDSSGHAQSVASSQTSQGRTSVPRPLRLPQTAGMQSGISHAHSYSHSTSLSTSTSDSHPPVSGSSKLKGPRPHTRTRTLSNPGSRIPGSSVLPRPAASSKIVPPRSVSAAVMAPIRSRSISSTGATSAIERSSTMSSDSISDFPLPPAAAGSSVSASSSASSLSLSQAGRGLGLGLGRPSPNLNTQVARSVTASPVSPPSATATRVLNTVGTGPRPPRIGTGMVYRHSGYSSFYETSRLSRASVTSPS